ncbi:MAG: hypothetical protein HGA87_06245 [Desulfobulbaceae bacterium]|jgi:hypothetical protein|nr:hypothetical protein [Desulfobulbaceae bacterium]
MKTLFARFTLIAAIAAVSINPAFGQKAPTAAEKKEIKKEATEVKRDTKTEAATAAGKEEIKKEAAEVKQDTKEENTETVTVVEEKGMTQEESTEMKADQKPDDQQPDAQEKMDPANQENAASNADQK